jgi:hypothetical protein
VIFVWLTGCARCCNEVGVWPLACCCSLSMKQTLLLVLSGLIGVSSAWVDSADAASPVTRRGTSVLHYMTRNTLVANEGGSNVVGQVRLQVNEQGGSSKQSLRVDVRGIGTNAPLRLIAVMGEDTNAVPVADLTSDHRGRVALTYSSNGQGRGGRHPLPEGLSPLTDLRSIGVENASTQTVAYAWIADADRFKYLVKRNLTPEDTNGTAAGQISLIANERRTHFRLVAGGLSATNEYLLALNAEIVGSVSSTEEGRVEVRAWPTNAPAILDLRSLALLDAGSNVVLRTALPK